MGVIDFSEYRIGRVDKPVDFPQCMKEKYGTEGKARQSAERMNQRRGSKTTKVGPYRCEICPGGPWHLRTIRPIEGQIKRRAAARWERDAAA